MTEYKQAWRVSDPEGFNGYVYDPKIMLDKFAAGSTKTTVDAVTIVRHGNGDREYLVGCLAEQVQAHREQVAQS